MSEAIVFANPPIVELVLGAQFSPLTKLTAGHYGLYWKHLGKDWDTPQDASLLEDQFEVFDGPRWTQTDALWRIKPMRLLGRFMIRHKDQQRLVQVQPTRFHFNWRKKDSFYPSYTRLISEFEQVFGGFVEWAGQAGLGNIAVNQWELTYIDAFPLADYWQTPADWSGFLPGLFGHLHAADRLVLEQRAAEWSYEITPKKGRLHIAARTGRWGENPEPALLLHMTARGPVGKDGVESLRAGLDLGHEVALQTFLRVTSKEAQQRWTQNP